VVFNRSQRRRQTVPDSWVGDCVPQLAAHWHLWTIHSKFSCAIRHAGTSFWLCGQNHEGHVSRSPQISNKW